ncbi:MAG: hypothetical protein JO104_07075 [Candidatus Eremiobacteraeota bacterium]|nr:hypothetical protein [Candidatus Eremiobacteraeota bacterium]
MTTSRADCEAAHALAGAIAVGEAGESDRDRYRAHVARCERCLHDLGGEREIERVMAIAVQARADERWEPDLRTTFARRRSFRGRWLWASAVTAVAIVSLGALSLQRKAPVVVPGPAISAQEAHALAALNTQVVPRREGRAESLVVGSAIPVTTAFTLSVNDRGTPLRCTITKTSGDRLLDRAVCNAAMRVHYSPRSAR